VIFQLLAVNTDLFYDNVIFWIVEYDMYNKIKKVTTHRKNRFKCNDLYCEYITVLLWIWMLSCSQFTLYSY